MTMISSQRYIDDATVEEKIASGDYIVTVASITDETGNEYRVVIDGHHSLEAARRMNVDPIWNESLYNYQREVDYLGFDEFLASHYMDSDWYDITTKENVF